MNEENELQKEPQDPSKPKKKKWMWILSIAGEIALIIPVVLLLIFLSRFF